MTAFLQYHRAAKLCIPPVAAYKAMCLMPVADILHCLYRGDLPDFTGADRSVQILIERRVTKHMADHDSSAEPACCLGQLPTFR